MREARAREGGPVGDSSVFERERVAPYMAMLCFCMSAENVGPGCSYRTYSPRSTHPIRVSAPAAGSISRYSSGKSATTIGGDVCYWAWAQTMRAVRAGDRAPVARNATVGRDMPDDVARPHSAGPHEGGERSTLTTRP